MAAVAVRTLTGSRPCVAPGSSRVAVPGSSARRAHVAHGRGAPGGGAVRVSIPEPRSGLAKRPRWCVVRAADEQQGNADNVEKPDSFLSTAEAGIIDFADLEQHEKFLVRLTVSSLNVLKLISKKKGVPVDELNAGLVVDFFVEDKQTKKTNPEKAIFPWEGPSMPFM